MYPELSAIDSSPAHDVRKSDIKVINDIEKTKFSVFCFDFWQRTTISIVSLKIRYVELGYSASRLARSYH